MIKNNSKITLIILAILVVCCSYVFWLALSGPSTDNGNITYEAIYKPSLDINGVYDIISSDENISIVSSDENSILCHFELPYNNSIWKISCSIDNSTSNFNRHTSININIMNVYEKNTTELERYKPLLENAMQYVTQLIYDKYEVWPVEYKFYIYGADEGLNEYKYITTVLRPTVATFISPEHHLNH